MVSAPETEIGARNGSLGKGKHCVGVGETGHCDGAAALPEHGSAPVCVTLYAVRKS